MSNHALAATRWDNGPDLPAGIEYDPDVRRIIKQVAEREGRTYGKYGCDSADMTSECWVWIMGHIPKIAGWRKSEERWMGFLSRSLQRHCWKAGTQTRAQHLGWNQEDLLDAVAKVIRGRLPDIYRDDVIEELELETNSEEDDSDRLRNPNLLVDIRWGYLQLNDSDRDVIDAFHRDGCRNKELAEEAGVTVQAMSNRHDKAVLRLAKMFGDPAEPRRAKAGGVGWVGRNSVSSAAARASINLGGDDGWQSNELRKAVGKAADRMGS